jgi:hypothetical protein
MMRNRAFAIGQAAILVLFTSTSLPTAQAQYGTEKDAKAMLERAVAAMKENKEKALEMFNKGEGGFKDRDLYVFCANVSDGTLTAHPYLKGEHLQDIVGKKGFPLGKEIMRTAQKERSTRLLTGGLALARTRRSRNTPLIRESEIKTAASATTRNDAAACNEIRISGHGLLSPATPLRLHVAVGSMAPTERACQALELRARPGRGSNPHLS